ncbi:MAG: hypothetical protein A3A94_01995 [Candidatus Portnoybacteria bacterium RIFCSPLOWO2_01_FULL_43_11]|uniref:DUF4012 domain-containing protein n=4 Tax=Candidatus Portnoyibacteriota TaxID=1817913 RepID=A0A1G2FCI9_9BACT|nr:MAG: hypothetical protein A2815_01810 [Candidatus Portnoybacteria bacterium RIFCSPHIGHO2_01_FULL_40_12b]OGZ37145.1 MAG: hypothetical protein A3D38_01225 [Candidatus Portnoybacteria bacterium RIFCSPHIGHO2_02_FULL_40_23]OGZ38789.1 MAG: hypothetical protein A3A94_01995 [Candidatus Portnoybacteria bacterium RIFCSPLOWO2_01_FULL_43_11]OGZ41131.1 MAG: hypothetical protein A3I20_02000 [Candidatus Portnoybacteria bacterium RIFCSPLOWO2_02_FULL_40_15]
MRRIARNNNKRKNRIFAAMFDVRPVTKGGDLDILKINQVGAFLDLKKSEPKKETNEKMSDFLEEPEAQIKVISDLPEFPEQKLTDEDIIERQKPIFQEEEYLGERLPTKDEILAELARIDEEEDNLKRAAAARPKPEAVEDPRPQFIKTEKGSLDELIYEDYLLNQLLFSKKKEIPSFSRIKEEKDSAKDLIRKTYGLTHEKIFTSGPKERKEIKKKNFLKLTSFLTIGLVISLLVPALVFLSQGLETKGKITASSLAAYENLLLAQESLEGVNFKTAEKNFGLAYDNFFEASQGIEDLGRLTVAILEQLPGGSLVASGSHLVKVGENLALAGENLSAAVNLFSSTDLFKLLNNKIEDSQSAQSEFLSDSIVLSQEKLSQALEALKIAKKELSDVEIETLPDDLREKTVSLKDKLPFVEDLVGQAIDYSTALIKILGHDNPREYLLIFQNNSEIRATGGFIGTYGLLTLDRGQIKKLFIDGVFNADGQLQEKIIPPKPIQKISTAWSMHDANWFSDFPTSAQKIAWFYEKTGGSTVDGVISLTPTVVERLLELTGPIEMPEYEASLNPENFVELIQYEVEADYDKGLNQPKKILADFAPKFIQALAQLSLDKQKKALEIIFSSLKEKHILMYFRDDNLEKFIEEQGWAGEILETEKDYLNVVSSNINGYKTDKVVNETIDHQAEIQEEGSIIDTLTITREHRGGGMDYDWWNRVNSNYLRVYLPKGSELLSATGHTIETYLAPIDYEKHGFKPDPLIKSIEDKMTVDPQTGTQIFEENNKTVFGNWVYVSPGQTVKITYQYKLPFKINLTKPSDSYSLLVQKQAGSTGSQFKSAVKFPENWKVSWFYPDNSQLESGAWRLVADLNQDRFFGVTFEID